VKPSALLLAFHLCALTLGSAPCEAASLAVNLAQGAQPVWQGISAENLEPEPGALMLYPGPAGTFLVAVLAHALIAQSAQDAQRSARQTEADKVLGPHANAVARLKGASLMLAVQHGLRLSDADAQRDIAVTMQPRFSMAADRRTIVLDNVVVVRDALAPAPPRFESIVRVVSAPREEPDPLAHWSLDDGRALADESVAMLVHSVELALAAFEADPGQAQVTQRYRFGAAQKMERGQAVASGCSRVVLRTLREWLMSVPVTPDADAQPCSRRYALRQD
jgi:hypothetical protein